ncbi:MAG: ribosome biogenesis GTP-binding protein YihA/YsxC [Candidatus Latescibacterota bacterium]
MEIRSAEFVRGAVGPDDLPTDGLPEVAFSGRSNVGKSSLINQLVQQRRLAHTSSSPGKTQQLNYYRVNDRLYLVDLPGYGYVRGGVGLREKLGRLTESYLQDRRELRAIVQLVDARHGPTDLDRLMVTWLRERGLPFLMVFTKADKVSRAGLAGLLAGVEAGGEFAEIPFTPFSAVSGEGRRDVLQWIVEAIGGPGPKQR